MSSRTNRAALTALVNARTTKPPPVERGGGSNESHTLVKSAPASEMQRTAAERGAKFDFQTLANAAKSWAYATVNHGLERSGDIARDKLRAAREFFAHADKEPGSVTPLDVQAWQERLRRRGLAPATVYLYTAHLSAFFEWLKKQPQMGEYLRFNLARVAFPRRPAAYTSDRSAALSDAALEQLWQTIERAAAADRDVIAVRDYALFRLFMASGMRRSEILNLRGRDVELLPDGAGLLLHARVKGGDYAGKHIADREAAAAIERYLKITGRSRILRTSEPLWLAHDRAAGKRHKTAAVAASSSVAVAARKTAAPKLTGHSFARRMNLYAEAAGLPEFHLHQLRHTYARIVAEESGSLAAAQDALGHRDLTTTRVYVRQILVKRDNFSESIRARVSRG